MKQQAQEWFGRGDHDIETAQLLYDERGYTDAIAYHIQQAIEKYLKGYREEIKADLDLAWQLVELIRQELKASDAQVGAEKEQAP